jgi:hypothetical protein
VILFGSAARGELTQDSDLDFLVIEPEVENPALEWLGKVHLPTGAVGLERVVAMAIAELGPSRCATIGND